MRTSLSVLLDVSCHKKHAYIWFMGGDLNVNGVGHAKHATGDILEIVIEYFLS